MSADKRKVLWNPAAESVKNSNLTAYTNFLSATKHLEFNDYQQLHSWSVSNPGDFWESIWHFSHIVHSKTYSTVMAGKEIRKAIWFEGSRLNYAENLLRHNNDKEALIWWYEDQSPVKITYKELQQQVALLAQAFKDSGVVKGDRVAAFISNRPEAIIGMLAAASLGAIWSSCSPDFGFEGVLDRFGQIKPKILIAVNGYRYNGKKIDLADLVSKISVSIPQIERIILIDGKAKAKKIDSPKTVWWDDYCKNPSSNTPAHISELEAG